MDKKEKDAVKKDIAKQVGHRLKRELTDWEIMEAQLEEYYHDMYEDFHRQTKYTGDWDD